MMQNLQIGWEFCVVSPHGTFQRAPAQVVPQADRRGALSSGNELEKRLVVFAADAQAQVADPALFPC